MKGKKVKPMDHLDPKSFSWKLLNYAISALICHDVNLFLADVGLEVSGKKERFWLCECLTYYSLMSTLLSYLL